MVTRHTSHQAPTATAPAGNPAAALMGLQPDAVKAPEVRKEYLRLAAEINEMEAFLQKNRAALKGDPAKLAAADTTIAAIHSQWRMNGEALANIDARLPTLTAAQRDTVLTLLPQTMDGVIQNSKKLRETAVVRSTTRPSPNAKIRAMENEYIDGNIFGNTPHDRWLADKATSINHTLVNFTDELTSGRLFQGLGDKISSAASSVSTAVENAVTPPPSATPEAPAADAAEPGDGDAGIGGMFSRFTKSAKLNGGGIAGGALGVGLAYLISSMFGAGPIKWVLMLLLAPLLGLLGASQLGPTISGWFGGKGKSESGQGVSQNIGGPGQEQAMGQGQQPEYQPGQANYQTLPVPFSGRRFYQANPAVFREVYDVRGQIPSGVSYDAGYAPTDPTATEQVYYGGRQSPPAHGRRDDFSIRNESDGDINVKLARGMEVRNADMAGVSVHGANVGVAPGARAKIGYRY